jgi:hypothetical protein
MSVCVLAPPLSVPLVDALAASFAVRERAPSVYNAARRPAALQARAESHHWVRPLMRPGARTPLANSHTPPPNSACTIKSTRANKNVNTHTHTHKPRTHTKESVRSPKHTRRAHAPCAPRARAARPLHHRRRRDVVPLVEPRRKLLHQVRHRLPHLLRRRSRELAPCPASTREFESARAWNTACPARSHTTAQCSRPAASARLIDGSSPPRASTIAATCDGFTRPSCAREP